MLCRSTSVERDLQTNGSTKHFYISDSYIYPKQQFNGKNCCVSIPTMVSQTRHNGTLYYIVYPFSAVQNGRTKKELLPTGSPLRGIAAFSFFRHTSCNLCNCHTWTTISHACYMRVTLTLRLYDAANRVRAAFEIILTRHAQIVGSGLAQPV
jgi:hypothetical protein